MRIPLMLLLATLNSCTVDPDTCEGQCTLMKGPNVDKCIRECPVATPRPGKATFGPNDG